MKLIPAQTNRDCLIFVERLAFKTEGSGCYWPLQDGFTVTPKSVSVINGAFHLECLYHFFSVPIRDKYFVLWDVECEWPTADTEVK